MKNKNTVIILLIVFVLICGYNLYWTFVQFGYESRLNSTRSAYNKATLKASSERSVEDSAAIKEFEALSEDRDFNATYKKAVDNSFTLGLDLQGGMFVTLEIGVENVIKQLAGNPTDTVFSKAIEVALKKQETAQEAFVPLFVESLKEIDPNASLGSIFADPDRGINVNTPESEVVDFLETEANSAIDRTFNIIRTRIDQFGVLSPNLQKQESTGRVLLELPGVKDPERVRKILRSTAKLEFWETVPIQEAFPYIIEINERLKSVLGIVSEEDSISNDSTFVTNDEEGILEVDGATDTSTEEDTSIASILEEQDTVASDSFQGLDEALGGDSLGEDLDNLSEAEIEERREQFKKENPLFAILQQPNPQSISPNSPVVGYALAQDTAQINEYFQMEEIQRVLPDDVMFNWTFKSLEDDNGDPLDLFTLIAIRTNLENQPSLAGDAISGAVQDFDALNPNEPVVSMRMNAEGSREWARITKANVGKSVAILLDNYVYSYPIVQGEINQGISQISGGFKVEEAQDLANVLKAGQLPVPARIVGEDVVGPTLGAQNIRSGIFSFILAFIITLIFMAVYYAKAGLVANLALMANMIFILGCSAAFTIVLTLPGMAAVVLTVGMAVDANVLIFERIREELAKEKTLKASIKSGFGNAFSSVMDANITTFLTGVILYAFGVGPIRGFAVALMIGIVTSLISALIITRLILDYYANKGKDSISFGYSFTTGLFDTLRINMVSRRKMFYYVSMGLVGISLISFFALGFKTGVDFKGGRQFVVEFNQDGVAADLSSRDVEVIREDLNQMFEGDAPIIKTLSSDNQLLITTSYLVDDREATGRVQEMMMEGLNQNYGQYDKTVVSSTDVGPTVASDIRRAAFLSVIGSMIVIFIYILIRFRKWQYSLGAIAAIFHDVIIVLGIFSLLSQVPLPINLEINQAMIAALLTIIGYSINDTVVVFDRIRENLGEMKSESLKKIYNVSIDQTLSRTLITSVTTILTALILLIFGGDVIKGFIFAILIGIIVGTYSSIFVASPISLDLIERKKAQTA